VIKAPLQRKIGAEALNHVLGKILKVDGVTDYTGGFMGFRREKILEILKDPDTQRELKKAEWGEHSFIIIKKASEKNMKIGEIPIDYEYRKKGESKSPPLLKVATSYIKAALRLKHPL
jgi:hypothetical protein